MMQVSEISTSTLYDRDFQLWLQETIRQLKTNEWNALDRHNLIEQNVECSPSLTWLDMARKPRHPPSATHNL